MTATIESLEQEAKEGPTLFRSTYPRTCDCAANHLNCMTAKEWIKSQIGVWQFNYESRDIRDKKQHPATFPCH